MLSLERAFFCHLVGHESNVRIEKCDLYILPVRSTLAKYFTKSFRPTITPLPSIQTKSRDSNSSKLFQSFFFRYFPIPLLQTDELLFFRFRACGRPLCRLGRAEGIPKTRCATPSRHRCQQEHQGTQTCRLHRCARCAQHPRPSRSCYRQGRVGLEPWGWDRRCHSGRRDPIFAPETTWAAGDNPSFELR